MLKKSISGVAVCLTCLFTLAMLCTSIQGQAQQSAVQPKICPTEELKKLKTFDAVEFYLIYGVDSRFGKFKALDPSEDFANLDDGSTWRLFKTEKESPDIEGVLCYKTIMLKSIIKHINSLAEVHAICKLELSGSNGVFDQVAIIEQEGEKSEYQNNLIARLNVFVSFYLNTFANKDESN